MTRTRPKKLMLVGAVLAAIVALGLDRAARAETGPDLPALWRTPAPPWLDGDWQDPGSPRPALGPTGVAIGVRPPEISPYEP